jgi:hypothetical protein
MVELDIVKPPLPSLANGVDMSMDETTASATASASTDAATPHNNQAKATRDQGYQLMKTNVSALSALCDHQDAVMMDPPRPSRDPVDTTGDNECHPDAPTEPPDMPEGTKG